MAKTTTKKSAPRPARLIGPQVGPNEVGGETDLRSALEKTAETPTGEKVGVKKQEERTG